MITATNIMKKLKSIFSRLQSFFKSKRVKENPIKDRYQKLLTSQPYIVNIENTTDESIENVLLFLPNSHNESSFLSDGNLEENGLKIYSGISNVSYKQISNNFIDNHCAIGLTYMQSANPYQVLQKLTFKYQDPNGSFFGKEIIPTIDPYQQQTNIVANKTAYFLDGNSSITVRKIYPKTVLSIYFYPETKMYDSKFNDGKYYTNYDISKKLQELLQINNRY